MVNGEKLIERSFRWAMVGGGRESQVGYKHRTGAQRDHVFTLVAGAFDIDPQRGKDFGVKIGVAPDRCYPDYQTMFREEAKRQVLNSGAYSQDIENIFRMMYNQICSENAGAEEICHHLLQALIILILKQIDRNIEPTVNNEDILGKRIKEYIDDHFSEEHTLESISEKLNISLSYLCHIFKKTTGYAPIQYIMRRRIGEAQSLLINTQYSATEIASMVGYDNSNYFNTIFTRMVGISPIKYRKCWVDENNPF